MMDNFLGWMADIAVVVGAMAAAYIFIVMFSLMVAGIWRSLVEKR